MSASIGVQPAGTVVALLLAMAILCWPGGSGPSRLRAVTPPRRPSARRVRAMTSGGPGTQVLGVAVAALAGAAFAGVGGALAAGLVGGHAVHRLRSGRRRRRDAEELAALVDVVGMLVGELRAGAHPAAAAASVSSVGNGSAHRVMAAVAAGARLGARVPALLARHPATESVTADGLRRLSSAWELAERHGVALADLADAVRADLQARRRLRGELRAQLAGPRATAAVLAGLPALGIVLGESVGAGPLRVLSDTGIGQGLLVVGTVLVCAGTAWCDRIMTQAGRS